MSESVKEAQARELAEQVLCRDPSSGERLEIASEPVIEGSSYSFEVRNPITGARWRHTIKTEEV